MKYRSTEAEAYRKWYGLAAWRGPKGRRADQLRREPLCRMCWTTSGRAVEANTADHITPHRGDAELFWNGELQSLCGPCHSRLKQQEETRGYHSAVDADGYPVDPNHPANRSTVTES